MAKHRGGRINEEIKKEVSSILRTKIKDPRLTSLISVTAVEVTKDLRYAKVFVSIFDKDEAKAESLKILRNSAGFIRKEIGSAINLRYTPEVLIELDSTLDNAMHIESLLQSVKEK